ncbi:MAG: hypothetical protein GY772_28235 [bacterium]|nr:hypothetical protein [bacterium]
MSLGRPTPSQQRCRHAHQTYDGTNQDNLRSVCVHCGYNVVHIGTNYVKEDTWRRLAQYMKSRAGASTPSPVEPATPSPPVPPAPSGLAPVLPSRAEPATAETERPREPEAETAEQPRETETEAFLRAARQKIELQYNRLNKLEIENRALKEKLEQAELRASYERNALYARLDKLEIEKSTLVEKLEANPLIEVDTVMPDETPSSSKGPSSRRWSRQPPE